MSTALKLATSCRREEHPGGIVLTRSGGPAAEGLSVAWTVNSGGRWIGWVYDHRVWDGYRFGDRCWAAMWREVGDSRPRWALGGLGSRRDAISALLFVVAAAGGRS